MDNAQNYLELDTADGETIKVLRKSHPQARRLRLTVTPAGARVTYPEGTHPAQIVAFLRRHGEWLERKLDELSLSGGGAALRLSSSSLRSSHSPWRRRNATICAGWVPSG